MITIKQVLSSFFKKPTLEQRLYRAAYPLVATNWHGLSVIMALRDLSPIQVSSVGDITMIKTFYDKIASKREPTLEEMNEYAERHHKLVQLAMAVPTYDEMIKIAGCHVDQAKIDRELREVRELFLKMPTGKEKEKLRARYNSLELTSKFLLPAEFTAPLVAWICGTARSDIDKVTHEMLVKAYVLSQQGHDNPADHISGVFERYPGDTLLKDDINLRAKMAYQEEMKQAKKPKVKQLSI